jgi:hypothetical protein
MAKAASPSSSNSFGLSLDEEGMAELLEMMDTAEAQQGPQKRKPTAPPDGQPAAAAGAQCGRSTGGTKVRRVGSPPGSGAGERCDHHHLPAPADAEGDGTMADVAVETAARTASDEERMGPAGASRSDMVAHSDPLDISEFIPRGARASGVALARRSAPTSCAVVVVRGRGAVRSLPQSGDPHLASVAGRGAEDGGGDGRRESGVHGPDVGGQDAGRGNPARALLPPHGQEGDHGAALCEHRDREKRLAQESAGTQWVPCRGFPRHPGRRHSEG